MTLLLDALKGTAAVLLGARWGQDAAILGGLGAFLGHLFPVWLSFRGGKGVATYIGVLLGFLGPWRSPFAPWLAVAALTRYSSLAALTAAAATPCSARLRMASAASRRFATVHRLLIGAMPAISDASSEARRDWIGAGTP